MGKEDRSAYFREYYQKNKKRLNAQHLKRYHNNKEPVRAASTKWRLKNIDRFKAKQREYVDKNKDKIAEYLLKNRDKINAKRRERYHRKKKESNNG